MGHRSTPRRYVEKMRDGIKCVLAVSSVIFLFAMWRPLSVDRLSYFETSAATGLNVSKAIDCLLDQVMLRMEKSIDKAHLLGMRNGTKVGDNDLQEVNEKAGCGC